MKNKYGHTIGGHSDLCIEPGCYANEFSRKPCPYPNRPDYFGAFLGSLVIIGFIILILVIFVK